MKVIDTGITEGLLDVFTGISAKTVKGASRKKLVQDIMYYQRKCMTLLKKLQMIPESVEDDEIGKMYEEIVELRNQIFDEAKKLGI